MDKSKIVFVSYNFYPPYYSGKLLLSHERFAQFDPKEFEIIVLTRDVEGLPEETDFPQYKICRSRNFGDGKIGRRLNAIHYWFWSERMAKSIKNLSAIHFDEPAVIAFPFLPGKGSKWGWGSFRKIAAWAKSKMIPTYYEYATADIQKDFDPEPEKNEFLDEISQIISVSYRLNDAVAQVYPEKAIACPCGIEEDLFVPLEAKRKAELRSQFEVKEGEILFSFVGLMVYRKGIDLICEAFNDLCEERDDLKLWMIGPESEKESPHVHDDEVEGYKKLLGNNLEKVHFFGNIHDRKALAELMAASDIFLFPTRREGFGLAPVEAMACGVPPIIARIEGITDLANVEGVTGLYIQPGNLEELIYAMSKLIENSSLREAMGIAARERVLEGFTLHKHAQVWQDLYRRGVDRD